MEHPKSSPGDPFFQQTELSLIDFDLLVCGHRHFCGIQVRRLQRAVPEKHLGLMDRVPR